METKNKVEKPLNVRTTGRIVAMMVLYNQDICKKIDDKLDNTIDMIEKIVNPIVELVLSNTESSREEDIENSEKPIFNKNFVIQLVNGVNNNLDDIDYELSVAIENYTIDRLSYVDRSLLRIGAYEILYTDTPKSIVINEIINISKIYSETEDYKTSKFNNAVLDKINKKNA